MITGSGFGPETLPSNQNSLHKQISNSNFQKTPNENQSLIRQYSSLQEPPLSQDELVRLLRQKIKYIFVIYQENRSFDSYFGTFPGAEGIFSHPPAETPGFEQPLRDTDGKTISIQPFRIGPKEYAADTDDVDHSKPGIDAKMHIVDGTPRMDRFALTEEARYTPVDHPNLMAKQMGELAEESLAKFGVRQVTIVHRLGRLEIGETSVLIVVAAAHRGHAFDACRWLIDTLKKTVPIWKKETFADGAVWADGEPFPDEVRLAEPARTERADGS